MSDPKRIRIVFLGTPGFAACSLEKLVQEKYNVVGVVTAPDKPAGRGQQIHQSEVKLSAVKNHIPVLQPEKLKSPEFLEQLKQLNPELMIVVAFRMLPEVVWSLPKMGTFNLHGSLLPHYRGAAPINWAIMNGETKTGVTTFLLQQEVDTGNVLLREEISIGANETAGELHDRMMVIGAELVVQTINGLSDNSLRAQNQATFISENEILHDAPKLFRETCKINWAWNGERIRNHVRGLNPFPTAWAELKRDDGTLLPMKIFSCQFEKGIPVGLPGTINSKLSINVADGTLIINELQAPGKKRLYAEEFLKGFKFTSSDCFV